MIPPPAVAALVRGDEPVTVSCTCLCGHPAIAHVFERHSEVVRATTLSVRFRDGLSYGRDVPTVPARCRSCGFVLEDTGIVMDSGASATFVGNRINCPRCGGWADLVDGSLEATKTGFVLHDGPEWSRELLERLRLVLPRVLKEQPEDPLAVIAEQVSAELAGRIDTAVDKAFKYHARTPSKSRKRDLVLKVAGYLVVALGFDTEVAQDNVEHAREVIENVLDFVIEHGSVPTTPPHEDK